MVLLRCYAKIPDWIYEFSNHLIDVRFLPVFSYGFMVACGFMAAAFVVTREYKRRESLGLLSGKEITVTTKPSNGLKEMITSSLIGFLVFFKVIGFFAYKELASQDPQGFIFSTKGSLLAGIFGLLIFGFFAWRDSKAKNNVEFATSTQTIYPSEKVGDMVVICAIFGILGSVLFNFLESPAGSYANFWQDPVQHLFSGLSVFGGMICAGAALLIFSFYNKFSIPHQFDGLGYCFILALGIGRLGCHVSGDADWGIANNAPKPAYIPQFLWADDYAHNIVNEGTEIAGCTENYCRALSPPVFPTPLYELIQCVSIFLILHFLRKKLTSKPGMLFFVFCFFAGIQRYTIEQIRATSDRELIPVFGAGFKQAELIALAMVLIGIVGLIYNIFIRKAPTFYTQKESIFES